MRLTKAPIKGMYTLINANKMATADKIPPSTIGFTREVLIVHLIYQYRKEFAQSCQFPAEKHTYVLVWQDFRHSFLERKKMSDRKNGLSFHCLSGVSTYSVVKGSSAILRARLTASVT